MPRVLKSWRGLTSAFTVSAVSETARLCFLDVQEYDITDELEEEDRRLVRY